MANIEDAVIAINPSAQFTSCPADDADGITWLDGTSPISKSDLEAKKAELQIAEDAAVVQKATDKASAKAKLIAGEALTQAEADTIVI
tara:strand:- start:300 stop:563 length:264 start_codon:yes stop_codon:yes gene_type:complete